MAMSTYRPDHRNGAIQVVTSNSENLNTIHQVTMHWEKLGPIKLPKQDHPGMVSHAANPTAVRLQDDLFRIFFTSRDINNRGHIAFADVEFNNRDAKVISVSNQPVLAPGEDGAFDDSGCSVGCIIEHNDKTYLYYLGWNLGVTVPWRNSVGLAVAEKGSTQFTRISKAPILDRSDTDPFTISYPWVIRQDGRFIMYYGSNLRWGGKQEDMDHVIKYATSDDGISWKPTGTVCIGLDYEGDFAIARPCVVKDGALYRMWYSYRGIAYRIGYAESPNAINWTRKDHDVGIDVSDAGWDAKQISYAHVFEHNGSWRMLYNGTRYGLTGFGHAIANF